MSALREPIDAPPRPAAVPLWFALALVPLVVSEVLRLSQSDVLAWIACDYGGRLVSLAALALIPAARRIAFAREQVRLPWWETALWIAAIATVVRIFGATVGDYLSGLVPAAVIGHYPAPRGGLFVVDVSFGLALVAYSEELIFRRCGRQVFAVAFGDGWAMIGFTAVLFAAYHWWTGAGNIVTALLFGVLAMLFYRRAGALAPVVLAHFLCDVMLAVWPV